VTEKHAPLKDGEWGGIVPRKRQLYPEEWGDIPPDPDARAGWILRNITLGQLARAGGAEVRWLHTPTPQEALGFLAFHVESPALASARRQAVLAISKVTGRLLELETRREPSP
jgi:hypothetical protein